MSPLFCPRSWFSHQLDGHAGDMDDNSVAPDLSVPDDKRDSKNPYEDDRF